MKKPTGVGTVESMRKILFHGWIHSATYNFSFLDRLPPKVKANRSYYLPIEKMDSDLSQVYEHVNLDVMN